MTAFVDTSAFYVAADRGDPLHARAVELLRAQDRLVTSDHVLVETWLLLNRRLGYGAAERFVDGVRSGAVAIESVTPVDLENAAATGERFANQEFSLVDRTSFAVMQRLGIRRVATFDDDFAVFRYGRDRSQAFEILR